MSCLTTSNSIMDGCIIIIILRIEILWCFFWVLPPFLGVTLVHFRVTFMLDLKHANITGIPFTKYGNRIIYFLHNSSSKIGWRRDIFFFTLLHHNITCFELYLCYNLIIVCYPVGRPSSWGIALPYVTPSPSISCSSPPLPSSSVCLCSRCVKTLQPASPASLRCCQE